jgi:hypothetical protein
VTTKQSEGYVVAIPDSIRKKIEEAPVEVQEDIEKLIQGFVDGTIDPHEVGEPVSDEEFEKLHSEQD